MSTFKAKMSKLSDLFTPRGLHHKRVVLTKPTTAPSFVKLGASSLDDPFRASEKSLPAPTATTKEASRVTKAYQPRSQTTNHRQGNSHHPAGRLSGTTIAGSEASNPHHTTTRAPGKQQRFPVEAWLSSLDDPFRGSPEPDHIVRLCDVSTPVQEIQRAESIASWEGSIIDDGEEWWEGTGALRG